VPLFSINENVEAEPPFSFTLENDQHFLESESTRLSNMYLDVGLPAAKQLASYEALAAELKPMCESLGLAPERYTICLHKLGRDRELLDHLSWCENGEYSEYLASFARGFRESIGLGKHDYSL
jgi:hypothetical protein